MSNSRDILLVEDNPDDAEMTARAFKKVNLVHTLVHVVDGQEALDYMFGSGRFKDRDISNQPKVILLDIKMPRLDGIEVLRVLKTNELTKNIPVVIMTSSGEENDLVTSYSLGVNSYVIKPVNFESFAKAVSELGLYWLLVNQTPDNRSQPAK